MNAERYRDPTADLAVGRVMREEKRNDFIPKRPGHGRGQLPGNLQSGQGSADGRGLTVMDLQETYDYLTRIRKTEYAIKRKQLQREELKSCLLPNGIQYDLDKVQTSPKDKVSEIMARVDELDRQIEELMQKKALLVIEIGEAIEQLPDGNEKTVLTGFYIGRMPMEKVAALIDYSLRRAYYFRKQGAIHLGELLSGQYFQIASNRIQKENEKKSGAFKKSRQTLQK